VKIVKIVTIQLETEEAERKVTIKTLSMYTGIANNSRSHSSDEVHLFHALRLMRTRYKDGFLIRELVTYIYTKDLICVSLFQCPSMNTDRKS
jgi:hypothetical protein